MDLLQNVIVGIRSQRKELGVPEKEVVDVLVLGVRTEALISWDRLIHEQGGQIERLARAKARESMAQPPDPDVADPRWRSYSSATTLVLYERQIDVPAERERLTKDLAKFNKGLEAADKQLGNEGFIARAPVHIVEGLKKQHAETLALKQKAEAALAALPAE